MASEERPFREVAERLRAQMIEEYKTRKLPSGAKEKWDAVDLGERAIGLAVDAYRSCGLRYPNDVEVATQLSALLSLLGKRGKK